MKLGFSEEQEMLRDSVVRFVNRQNDLGARRQLIAGDEDIAQSHWQTFAELGWLAVPFPESLGGLGGRAEETAVLMEEFGRGLVIDPYVSTVLLAGRLLAESGDEAQRRQFLGPLMAGQLHGSFAYLERQSRFELSDVATNAAQTDDGFVLNGQKVVVLNAASSDVLVVSARTAGEAYDEEGISLFIVSASAAGLSRKDHVLMDGSSASHVQFDDVRIPQDALLGTLHNGFEVMRQVVDQSTLDLASEGYGIMDALHQKTVAYLKTREQFGQPISSFQAVQHRLVNMYIACEEVKSLVFRGLCAMNSGDDLEQTLHALKYKLEEGGKLIWEEAIQLHGGMGMTDELDIGHYVKRLMMICTAFGDGDYHLDAFIERDQAGAMS